jgi:hypothetical protein
MGGGTSTKQTWGEELPMYNSFGAASAGGLGALFASTGFMLGCLVIAAATLYFMGVALKNLAARPKDGLRP